MNKLLTTTFYQHFIDKLIASHFRAAPRLMIMWSWYTGPFGRL